MTVPVRFETYLVGDINTSRDDGVYFRYSEHWLRTPGAFPLSVTMPLGTVSHPERVILPWIANLLPEAGQLHALARMARIDQTDVLGLLREIGGDTAGALSFGEPSSPGARTYTPLTQFYATDDDAVALEMHMTDLEKRPFMFGTDGVRQSLAGGQVKSALAVLDPDGNPVLQLPEPGDKLAIPRNGAPSTLVVKPANRDFLPGISENEAWCLRMASTIGIPAAKVMILNGTTRNAVGVLRYDRKLGRNGMILRVHQEDFAQANGLTPGQKYERGSLPGLDLMTLLRTGRNASAADEISLLDQVIFNIVVVNTDAHAKNHSLLLPMAGQPRLAPLYDVSCVLSWPNITRYYAQDIAGRKRSATAVAGRHWDRIAQEGGYRPSNLRERVKMIVDQIVANMVMVTRDVEAMAGASAGYVRQTAEDVERNALRLVERL